MFQNGWTQFLKDEFEKPYFKELSAFLTQEYSTKTIYPKKEDVFSCFGYTDFDDLKVVILGQDPYHQPGQAMGLSFSVPPECKIPPSLMNIYKELNKDIGMPIPSSGDLTHWATQGVLLLNSVLTVRADEPGSHSKIGWTQFTDDLIQLLSKEKSNLVFILWGNYASQKQILIDATKHKILKAAHPSPLSAYNGFFGCKHFSATNQFLNQVKKDPIDWSI